MQNQLELEARELALDACIDRLVSGGDWQATLPSDHEARRDVLGLLAVAGKLVEVASLHVTPAVEMKQRVWRRVTTSSDLATNHGFFRRLTAFKVLYSPPSRPGALERVLFARVPGVPPLFVRFAEAS
ncbi:MAG: hypothetical protein WD557_04415 [Dehalococcoidia bacterium]